MYTWNYHNIVNRLYLLCCSLCLTLCNPMGCSLPGSSVCGIPQARILELIAIAFSKGSSCLIHGSNLGLLHCRHILCHLNHQGSPNWLYSNIKQKVKKKKKSSAAGCLVQTFWCWGRYWELGLLSWLEVILPGLGFMVCMCFRLSCPFAWWISSQSLSIEESLCYFLDFSQRLLTHAKLIFDISMGGR